MKVSEAMKQLTEILANCGDLEIIGFFGKPALTPEGIPFWHAQYNNLFDVLGVPNPVGHGEELVCVFMEANAICECEEEPKERPRLALVKEENPDEQD